MKKEKMVPGIVIYAIIVGRKNYISAGRHRSFGDKTLLVDFSTDIEDAIPFKYQAEVDAYVAQIHNIHPDRTFQSEKTLVKASDLSPEPISRKAKTAVA